ncbi:receptor-type tyrosine-protein phosphatase epsilon-like [Haliotis asinina]|uniref:receptor-type tyrosine-protein phosphatase epsilon-like n=1 Tax=Haliotis asinina TaxID=109174 RepID=UPI0035324131
MQTTREVPAENGSTDTVDFGSNWTTAALECSAYWFGDQCDRECRCKDTYEVCDTRTGQCDSGCEDGWTGLDCHSVLKPNDDPPELLDREYQKCQDGTYGFNCTGRCGRCQSGQSCYKIGGECESCAHGFKPPFCQVCEDYFYGEQCSSTCGHCRDNANCNNVSGECPDGCEPGWQGMTCHHECDEGRYGDGCAKACGRCAGTCSPVNGSCDQEGCRDGWTGQRCDEACPDGTFGQACSDQCGQCLGGEVCDKETGVCLGSWCERGWKGHRCLTDCNGTGFYGHNCNETCGMCIEELCDPITGECPRGCRIKYVGATCTVQGDGGLSEEGDADGIYVNVERTKVKVAELREYIARREDKFVSEYGRVPRGLIHPHTAATTPEHKPKNRFKAMYPYDHSRVVLQKTPGDKHSDYINANYIDTYARKKAFIATQGPMPRTVGDFWRMVWQEEADIIVMLTRLKEGIKVKCEKYWPEKKTPLKLGDMTITNDGVTERPDYCIRQITIQHKKLNERRQVMHLHYVTWPDHDVPSCPPLVRFWKVFRSMASDSKAPVVVHCSAGVGRTGTFIALEALMERARREGVVDVHEFVLKMRADRVSMVQTKEQYLFLHQVVLEALYSDMTHMTPTMFDSRFCTDNLASASEEAILKKEWEKLIELKEHLNASETEGALLPENSRKNRSMDILPADKYRPILTLPVAESNDYINAVFVPTETRQKRLLATQLPLPWTMVDFWRMVFDHNVQTVVSLVSEECSSQVDEALFWPKTNKVLECGPFRVEKLEPKNKAITLTVSLMDTDESTKREVMLMFVSDWEEGVDTPTNTSRFLCLINDLDVRIASDNIAVMCMDGASKCGLLCAVLNIIQRLKQDQEIDVYLTVRLLQTVRTSFVTSFVQYQFCYRMIKEYQKTNNTVYENFRGKGLVEQRNLQNR